MLIPAAAVFGCGCAAGVAGVTCGGVTVAVATGAAGAGVGTKPPTGDCGCTGAAGAGAAGAAGAAGVIGANPPIGGLGTGDGCAAGAGVG